MFRKILVPLDGSELAEGVLPFVSQLARSPDVSLVLLSVLDPGAVEPSDNPPPLESVEGKTRQHLEEVVQRLVGQGVNARAVVAVGKPDEEIVRSAEKEGCDLVAMSTRGGNDILVDPVWVKVGDYAPGETGQQGESVFEPVGTRSNVRGLYAVVAGCRFLACHQDTFRPGWEIGNRLYAT